MQRQYLLILLSVVVCVSGCGASLAGQENPAAGQEILLWPDGAPGAKGRADEDTPSLTVYMAPKEKATDTFFIVCPGGGYWNLCDDYEGEEVARWMNSLGVSAGVLKYRLAKHDYHFPAPLQDAQRAISLVRSRADEWGISAQKIGIGGFSAGGHLSSMTGVHFDRRAYESADAIDERSCRPDFLILVYPAINMQRWGKGGESKLLGDQTNAEMLRYVSTHLQVTPQTPPAFLVHGSNDQTVPVADSINFYTALRKAGVKAEMHLYEDGPHGFGLGQTKNTKAVTNHTEAIASWPVRCKDWLEQHDLLEKRPDSGK